MSSAGVESHLLSLHALPVSPIGIQLQQELSSDNVRLFKYIQSEIISLQKLQPSQEKQPDFRIERVQLPDENFAWIASSLLSADLKTAMMTICPDSDAQYMYQLKKIYKHSQRSIVRATSKSDADQNPMLRRKQFTVQERSRIRRTHSFTEYSEIQHEKSTGHSWGFCIQEPEGRKGCNTRGKRLYVLRPVLPALKKVILYLVDTNGHRPSTRQEIMSEVQELESYFATRKLSQFYYSKSQNWKPNFEAKKCDACSICFTWKIRRHHCRVCGNVFCGRCSSMVQLDVPILSNSSTRICSGCIVASAK